MPLPAWRIGLVEGLSSPRGKGISGMQLSHTQAAVSAVFDEPNLVSAAGLVPLLQLAWSAGLHRLADEHLSVPTDKGANAGLKVASLVAGMAAGADSIDDMRLLRHGGMGRVFTGCYALPIRSGGAGPAAGCRAGAGRPRRHDRGSARLRQAGRRVRLLEGSRAERVAGHRHHGGVRAGDRGVSAAPRVVRFTARRETAGRRHA